MDKGILASMGLQRALDAAIDLGEAQKTTTTQALECDTCFYRPSITMRLTAGAACPSNNREGVCAGHLVAAGSAS